MRFNLPTLLTIALAAQIGAADAQTDPTAPKVRPPEAVPPVETPQEKSPAEADTEDKTAAKKKSFELAPDLDGLFGQLKRTRDKRRAQRIAQRIWLEWQTSKSRSIDLLTNWARAATSRRQYGAALDLLDQVVVINPQYAEGWNQRATVHFVMKNYSRSIADIERTLALEPRHFGALGGLAAIQELFGRDRDALATWYRALNVYPAMKSAQDAVIRLEEELAGKLL